MRRYGLSLLLFLSILGGACAPSAITDPAPLETGAPPLDQPPPAAEQAVPNRVSSPTAAAGPGDATEPALDQLPGPALLAVEDLSSRLGLPAGQIEVLLAEEVTWPDASMGCPQEGTAYAQVLTPGYRVVLSAGDALYEYHTDTGSAVAQCGEGPPQFQVTPGEIMDGIPWMPVD